MNRIITIISLILNVILIAYILSGANLSTNRASKEERAAVAEQTEAQKEEEMKTYILKKERAELPVRIQELHGVRNVTIDSVVITNPNLGSTHDGYLVTQWEFDGRYKKGTKTVYVELSFVRTTRDGYDWKSQWSSTDYDVSW